MRAEGVLVGLLAALLAAALPAQATLTLHVDFPAGELAPGVEVAVANATVTLDCAQALLRVHGIGLTVPVAINVTAPDGVQVMGNPAIALPIEPCRSGAQTTQRNGLYSVSVTLAARAHRSLPFALVADLPADPQAGELAPHEAEAAALAVSARAVVAVTLESPQALHLVRANQTFAFRLTNHGNAPLQVRGTLAFATPLASAAPATLFLASPTDPESGPAAGNLTFTLHAPDKLVVSEFTGTATLRIQESDGPANRTLEAPLFFRNEVPATKSSPAPAALPLGLALLAVAWARRRA